MKDAIFLTGAAARISQEIAFIDKLIENKKLSISSENILLAGFSSGALNIAAINACYRNEYPLSWNDYYKNTVLFKIQDSDVFHQNKLIPLDTNPLRKTIIDFLEKSDMKTLGDLTFQSFILTFSFRRLMTLWTYSKWNRHNKLYLSDLLMASSAIPILFPDQAINCKDESRRRFTRGRFADGGTGGSFKRFEYYLNKYIIRNGKLDRIFIISPMREVTSEDYDNLSQLIPVKDIIKLDLKEFKLLKLFLEMISQNGFDSFIHRLYKWTQKRKIANEIFVCIPALEKNFPILKFNKQKEQYEAVSRWIDENPEQLAVPLEQYVQRIDQKLMNQKNETKKFFRL
jgi:hypothetical protein